MWGGNEQWWVSNIHQGINPFLISPTLKRSNSSNFHHFHPAGKPKASTRCSIQNGKPTFSRPEIFTCGLTLNDLKQNVRINYLQNHENSWLVVLSCHHTRMFNRVRNKYGDMLTITHRRWRLESAINPLTGQLFSYIIIFVFSDCIYGYECRKYEIQTDICHIFSWAARLISRGWQPALKSWRLNLKSWRLKMWQQQLRSPTRCFCLPTPQRYQTSLKQNSWLS